MGVILYQELKFNEHTSYLKHKLIGRTKMLGKLRPLVGQEISLCLYKTLILPVLDYVDVVYDCLSVKDNAQLQRVQNYALRVILQCGGEVSTAVMHQLLNMQMLCDKRHCHTITYVYKCRHGLAPERVASQLLEVEEVHGRSTRAASRHDLVIPNFNLEMSHRSFRFRGPFYWNLTDCSIQESPSVDTFKRALYASHMF